MPKPSPLPTKLLAKLETAGKKFAVLAHRTVYTAADAAATMRRKEHEIAKALLVKAGPLQFVVILSANRRLDTVKLALLIAKQFNLKKASVSILPEKAVAKITGSSKRPLAAFASLYKLPVIIDHELGKLKKAVFPGGSFTSSVEMAVADFIRLEEGVLGKFSMPRPKSKAKPKKKPQPKKKTKSVKRATKKPIRKTKARKK